MPSANGDKSDQDALITGRIGELRMVRTAFGRLMGTVRTANGFITGLGVIRAG